METYTMVRGSQVAILTPRVIWSDPWTAQITVDVKIVDLVEVNIIDTTAIITDRRPSRQFRQAR